jgi:hypothetical protein
MAKPDQTYEDQEAILDEMQQQALADPNRKARQKAAWQLGAGPEKAAEGKLASNKVASEFLLDILAEQEFQRQRKGTVENYKELAKELERLKTKQAFGHTTLGVDMALLPFALSRGAATATAPFAREASKAVGGWAARQLGEEVGQELLYGEGLDPEMGTIGRDALAYLPFAGGVKEIYEAQDEMPVVLGHLEGVYQKLDAADRKKVEHIRRGYMEEIEHREAINEAFEYTP